MHDLVSVIMPSYNCGKFVEDAIRSVQAQTYQNWEIVFVDDSSTDDTVKIVYALKEKDSRIRLFRNVGNSGAAVSRNHALREARGKWIAFLDSDDLWEPTKLEKQVKFMVENGYSFSYTNYQEIDEDSHVTGTIVTGPQCITENGMRNYCWPGLLTVMYDVEKVGLVQIADIKKNNCYAMWMKVVKSADCYLLDECLARYRRGRSGSVSSQGIMTLIGWHYKLWYEAEGKGLIPSLWYTAVNLVWGFYKKVKYVHKTN